MYLTTNDHDYIVTERPDGTLAIAYLNGIPVKNPGSLIVNLGGIEAVKSRLTDQRPAIDAKTRKRILSVSVPALLTAARETAADPNASAADLLAAARTLSRYCREWSPELHDIFIGENALSKALLAYGGSYTFQAYDNGETLVKFRNGERFTTNERLSNFRNAKPIRSIIAETC